MPSKPGKLSLPLFCLVVAGFCLELCLAQFQVNMQVNTQVNRGIYAGPNMGSMQYNRQNAQQNPLMASENRYQRSQSGLLPSENRYGIMAAGPLAPTGSMTYLPGTPLSRAVGAPPAAPTGILAARAPSYAAPSGSMRFSQSYGSYSQAIQPVRYQPATPITMATPMPGPINTGLIPSSPISGSIMYN